MSSNARDLPILASTTPSRELSAKGANKQFKRKDDTSPIGEGSRQSLATTCRRSSALIFPTLHIMQNGGQASLVCEMITQVRMSEGVLKVSRYYLQYRSIYP